LHRQEQHDRNIFKRLQDTRLMREHQQGSNENEAE
jgi:hypothetical protein